MQKERGLLVVSSFLERSDKFVTQYTIRHYGLVCYCYYTHNK